MTDNPRQQMRDVIRDKVLARWVESAYSGDAPDLPFEGDCDRIADWVMELFPDVEVNREHQGPGYVLGANGPAFGDLATHTRLVLRTAPEPIEETQP